MGINVNINVGLEAAVPYNVRYLLHSLQLASARLGKLMIFSAYVVN